jgi:hypothetical protein
LSPDPVAWTVIEKGWKVIGSDGSDLGKVAEVRGDYQADIFDGLDVSGGLLKDTRYVPSEQVGPIYEGEVHLLVDHHEFEALPPA